MEQQLRTILGEVGGLVVPSADLTLDQDLFAAGLTSFATVTVMLAIEEAFDVEFPDKLLNRETFRSLASLIDTVTVLRKDRLAA